MEVVSQYIFELYGQDEESLSPIVRGIYERGTLLMGYWPSELEL
jgi:hypothetical protein